MLERIVAFVVRVFCRNFLFLRPEVAYRVFPEYLLAQDCHQPLARIGQLTFLLFTFDLLLLVVLLIVIFSPPTFPTDSSIIRDLSTFTDPDSISY
jgi:hypothetical protein